MKALIIMAALAALLASGGCSRPTAPHTQAAIDSEIQRLESAKWHPSSIGSREAHLALFADDFVTVEYGADVHGGVERKTGAKLLMSENAGVFQMLDRTQFDLADWRFIHADENVVVVSYHVSAPAFQWNAYATSVWAKQGDRWQTLFYQASTAK